jgi:murein DD-endopeptidase MepM/ murein hydrolase activator NlpD
VLLGALALGGIGVVPALAQAGGVAPPDGILQVTTSTTTASTTPPSTAPAKQTTATSAPKFVPSGVSGYDDVPADVGPFPPELQAAVRSVKRTAPKDNSALVAATAPLAFLGLDLLHQAQVAWGNFPVAGRARWTDDWWTPRYGPGWRLHEGLDIAADYGTPVLAPAAGTVHLSNGGNGGLGVKLTEANTNYWYLAHLSSIAPGIEEGTVVQPGTLIAHVGDSGNAEGQPHLHLEFHPRGGSPSPPKPILDFILKNTVAGAPAKVAAYEATLAAASTTTEPELRAQLLVPDDERLVQLLLTPLTPEPLRWVLAR